MTQSLSKSNAAYY